MVPHTLTLVDVEKRVTAIQISTMTRNASRRTEPRGACNVVQTEFVTVEDLVNINSKMPNKQ